jgi:hypothetical protein
MRVALFGKCEREIPLTFTATKTHHRSMGGRGLQMEDYIALYLHLLHSLLKRVRKLAHEAFLRVQEITGSKDYIPR